MADPTSSSAARTARLDLAALAGGVFFLAAVAAAAYPALRAGPASAGGLMLLLGLGGVAVLGLFAWRRGAAAPEADGAEAGRLLDALGEPAALISHDGRVLSANDGWRSAFGPGARLGRAQGAPGLFAALKAASRGEAARIEAAFSGRPWTLTASRFDGRRLLLRLAEPAAPAAPAPEPAAAAPAPAALDALAAAAPFGAALLDGPDPFAAAILECNPALQAMAPGLADPGRPFAELIEPASRTEAAARIASGRPGAIEVKLAGGARAAHLYLSQLSGRSLAYLVDVSEQKQLELQLAQSQKMQAIGQLAGGVAHDFNNLLTAIQLRLDELLHRHPVGDPSYEGLAEIRQTALRAADLVRKLLAFSRKQTVQRETLELGELISEFEVLLRRLLREDVRLETDYGRNLPLVRADKSQLETAVMNLAVNARDAMRSQGRSGEDGKAPGVVRIRTARLTQAEARQTGYPEAGEGEWALIEVADTGPGIPPEVLSKIFEPFFTTKPVGEGTGLGLSTVYGIVKQADGFIHVDSRLGEGSAFRIFLPVYTPPPSAGLQPAEPPKPKPAARDLSGVGRILFVEDEDAVRGVAARLLRARGYEVIEASDGEEALELAEQHAGQIDLLISDVIMPGLDGPTMLKKARRFLGEAPVMFISGYAEAEFSDLLEGETGVTFLPKPLDIKILAEKVKQQLAA